MNEDRQHNNNLREKFEHFEFRPSDGLFDRIQEAGTRPGGQLAGTFAGFEVGGNAHVWHQIEAELYPKKKKRVFIWRWVGAAALLLLGDTLSFQSLHPPVFEQSISEHAPIEKITENGRKTPFLSNPKPKTIDLNRKNQENEEPNFSQLPEQTLPKNWVAQEPLTPVPGPMVQNPINEVPLLQPGNPKMPESMYLQRLMSDFHLEELPPPPDDNLTPPLPKRVAETPSNGLAMSFSPTFLDAESINEMNELAHNASSNASYSYGPTTFSTNERNYTNLEEFFTPLIFGADFEWYFKPRWSTVTGFQYTMFKITQNYEYVDGQRPININHNIRRSYLGLPIQLKFNFVQRPQWSSYLKSGVLPETGLSEVVVTHITTYGEPAEITKTRSGLKTVQVAGTFSTGVNVNLIKHLSIYAEFGVVRYVYLSNYNYRSTRKNRINPKFGMNFKLR